MKEKIKSVMLFSLTVLTVILVFFLWFRPVSSDEVRRASYLDLPDQQLASLLDIKSLNLGSQQLVTSYYYDIDDVFADNCLLFAEVLSAAKAAQLITPQYYYQRQHGDFIEYTFDSAIDAKTFLSLVYNREFKQKIPFSRIDALMLVDQVDRYLYVRAAQDYYQLPLNQSTLSYQKLAEALADADDSVRPYQTLYDRLNLTELEPFYPKIYVPTIPIIEFNPINVIAEPLTTEPANLRRLAQKVFGSQLDFVQSVTDVNGVKVMLYGYGEKSLKITPDGAIEYTENAKRESGNNDLIANLQLAVKVIKYLTDTETAYYLQSIDRQQEANAVSYHFTFYYRINHYRVVNPNQLAGISVTTKAGRLTSLQRHIKRSQSMKLSEQTGDIVFKILDKRENFNIIINQYSSQHADFFESADSYKIILQSLSAFDAVYFDDGDEMIPVYRLSIDNRRYYFNTQDFSLIYQENLL